MTYDSTHSGHSAPSRTGESYLDSIVQTASPARLRLMLIERAIDVAGTLSATWRAGEQPGTNEHSLKLLDLLTELLGGVVGGKESSEKEVCEQVSDLYVFLTKHLIAAEETSDAGSIDEISTVLQVDAETWRAVCAQESTQSAPVAPAVTGGLNLEA